MLRLCSSSVPLAGFRDRGGGHFFRGRNLPIVIQRGFPPTRGKTSRNKSAHRGGRARRHRQDPASNDEPESCIKALSHHGPPAHSPLRIRTSVTCQRNSQSPPAGYHTTAKDTGRRALPSTRGLCPRSYRSSSPARSQACSVGSWLQTARCHRRDTLTKLPCRQTGLWPFWHYCSADKTQTIRSFPSIL